MKGWIFWEPEDWGVRMIELFDAVDCRLKDDVLE
jgi:hypothetical protein